MIYKFRNHVTITSLEKFKFVAGEIFEQSGIWCSVSNVEASKSSEVAVIVIWHIHDRQGNDGKKDKITKYKVLVAEYETDGNIWNLLLASGSFGIVTKSKERYVEVNLTLQEAFYKVRTGGDFWWVRSRRISTRRFTEMQATSQSLKTRSSLTVPSDVSRSFETMQNNGPFENILYFRFIRSW